MTPFFEGGVVSVSSKKGGLDLDWAVYGVKYAWERILCGYNGDLRKVEFMRKLMRMLMKFFCQSENFYFLNF